MWRVKNNINNSPSLNLIIFGGIFNLKKMEKIEDTAFMYAKIVFIILQCIKLYVATTIIIIGNCSAYINVALTFFIVVDIYAIIQKSKISKEEQFEIMKIKEKYKI